MIRANQPDQVSIFIHGNHGHCFKPDLRILRPSHETKKLIRDNSEVGYSGGGVTAGRVSTYLFNKNDGVYDSSRCPSKHYINKRLEYQRRKERKGRNSAELVQDFIRTNPPVIYPRPDQFDSSKEWCIVLATDWSLRNLTKHGSQIVGLDAVWKWTSHRLPLWAVTATDERNHVVLGAVCYASTGNARALGIFIQQLQLKLPSWTPIFMIDKDKAERAAVLAAGILFLFALPVPCCTAVGSRAEVLFWQR
jgi:hypothetical protein